MKKLIRMLTLGVMAAVLAVPAFARLNSELALAMVQDEDAKNALYSTVTTNINTNQPVAYEAAKEYLKKWPNDDDAIAKYLKDFVAKYEKATRKIDLGKAIAAQKWPEAFDIGKKVIQDDPADLAGYYNTSWAGLQLAASGNNTMNSEASALSTKTIQMIESGKTLEAGKPYEDSAKQKDLGWLNFSLYLYSLSNNMPDAAAGYLIKAAQYENPIKSDPNTYLKLVKIYEAEYEKRSQDYATRFGGKDQTPESEAALERVKQEADLLIDSIARAIAYSGTDPKTQQARDALKKSLTEYYEFRHGTTGSATGVDALIAGIKSKPLPKPGEAAPATPPATTSTPAPTSNTSAADTKPSGTTTAMDTAPSTTTKSSTGQTSTPEKKATTPPAGTNGGRPRRK